MSSNPYVVRTDSLAGFLGVLKKEDLEPQIMAAAKLKQDRRCSREIQALQNQCLAMLTAPGDSGKHPLAQILARIRTMQNLQNTFDQTTFTSSSSLHASSQKLNNYISQALSEAAASAGT